MTDTWGLAGEDQARYAPSAAGLSTLAARLRFLGGRLAGYNLPLVFRERPAVLLPPPPMRLEPRALEQDRIIIGVARVELGSDRFSLFLLHRGLQAARER